MGVFFDFEVINLFLKLETRYTPIDKNVSVYTRLKPVFVNAYSGLKEIFSALSEIQKEA